METGIQMAKVVSNRGNPPWQAASHMSLRKISSPFRESRARPGTGVELQSGCQYLIRFLRRPGWKWSSFDNAQPIWLKSIYLETLRYETDGVLSHTPLLHAQRIQTSEGPEVAWLPGGVPGGVTELSLGRFLGKFPRFGSSQLPPSPFLHLTSIQ